MHLVTKELTVWVHGTLPHDMLSTVLNALSADAVANFFHCEPGLNAAQLLDKKYHHRTIADTLSTADSQRFALEGFYLYCWPGDLSFAQREQSARELYTALTDLVADYKKKHDTQPTLRIITHSHGGNVALNLAPLHEEQQNDLIIDELILLACPVQKATEKFASSSLFKRVYALHSHLDMIQVLDPQGIQKPKTPFFSGRHFPPSDNLIQARCKSSGRDLLHIEFMLAPFLRTLPARLDALRNHLGKPGDIVSDL